MALRDLLARLRPRRSTPEADEQSRRAAADRLERSTQAHYRSVTQSDATGRSTKRDD